MPKLFVMPETCALAPNIAVAWLDAPVEIANLAPGDHKTDAFRAINPQGKVPVLQYDDGTSLTEAAAILGYLGATYGKPEYARDTRLVASEAEALAYMTSEVHADFKPVFAIQTIAESDATKDEVRRLSRGTLADHFEYLDSKLRSGGDWYLGERSFADAYLYVIERWASKIPLALESYPALDAHLRRMQADAGVQTALARQNMKPL